MKSRERDYIKETNSVLCILKHFGKYRTSRFIISYENHGANEK